MLVLVGWIHNRLTWEADGLGRVVLDRLAVLELAGLRDAEHLRERDELLDQLHDVVLGQRALVERLVQVEAAVQLVTADAREVVALRVEEQLVQQVARTVDRRRLARALLAEQLDQRTVD